MDEAVDIDTMLKEVARSLPAAQDTESSDKEEAEVEEVEKGESMTVFSRADHLRSLGFNDALLSGTRGDERERTEREFENSDIGGHEADDVESTNAREVATMRQVAGSVSREHGTQTEVCETGIAAGPGDMEWNQFRTDFMEQLQSSSHEVRLESGDPAAVKEHLLMKAISELQTQEHITTSSQSRQTTGPSTARPDDRAAAYTCTSDQLSTSSEAACGNNNCQSSGDPGPVSLLSTSMLDGIEMSALDRALNEVEVGGANTTSGQRSNECPPPRPKLAWVDSGGDCGNGGSASDLMSQLTAISKTQQLGVTEGVQTREEGRRAAAGEVGELNQGEGMMDEDKKRTVYIDLRSPQHQPDSDRVPCVNLNQLRQSTSESEESDDQMSWAQKRQQIKSTLSPTHHNLHHTHRTEEPTESVAPTVSGTTADERRVDTEPTKKEEQTEAEKENKQSREEGKMSEGKVSGINGVLTHLEVTGGGTVQSVASAMEKEESKTLCDVEPEVHNSPGMSPDFVYGGSSGRMDCETVQQASSGCEVSFTEVQLDMLGTVRQHSTESLTLSSSYSDGEISPTKPIRQVITGGDLMVNNHDGDLDTENKKEGATKKNKRKRKGRGGKGQKDGTQSVDSTGSSPEVGRAELGARDKKEGGKKKDRKGEKRKEGSHKMKKKGDSVKAKKASIQRIRFDSLTTSSDEERGIDSPRLSRVEEVVEPLPEREEVERKGESEERLRQRLEHKILSKKPPAMFMTPATEPLFHQDVSFSPVLCHMDSCVSTDILLILPLSSADGLVSLPLSHPHISPEAHLALHSLLLTYLAVTAARCSTMPAAARPAWTGKQSGTSPPQCPSSHSKLPLRITALYQTILDEQLSVLIGASLPQGRKRSVSYPSIMHRGAKKSTKTSGGILSPLDAPRNPYMVEVDGTLCGLKVRDLLGDVMEGSGPQCTEEAAAEEIEKVVLAPDILNEIRPLLNMSTQTFLSVHPDTDPLTTPTSFYWHSLYRSSCLPSSEALCTSQTLQSTMCVLPSESLSNPSLVFHTIHGAYALGLSIAGLRMVYGEPCLTLDLPAQSGSDDATTDHPVTLVLCLRGPDAVSQCMDLTGPEDYNLAKVTDPCSIMARFGSPENQPMQCVRTPFRVSAALSKWFGGRGCLHTGSLLGMTDSRTRSERRKRQRVRFSESDFESEDNLPPPTPDICFPPLVANRPLLAVLPYDQVLLIVSPLLPPLCYGSILATCGRLDFDISGAKRVRLNSKRAAVLDIPVSFVSHFTPSSTPPSPDFASFSSHPLDAEPPVNIPPLPSLLLIVCRENALVQSCALKTAIITDLKALLPSNPQLEEHVQLDYPVGGLLHAVPYRIDKLKLLGSFASTTVTSVSSLPQLAPEWEKEGENFGEEISFLAVTRSSGLAQAVDVLQLVFGVKAEKRWDGGGLERGQRVYESDQEDRDHETQNLGGIELLGMKLIPQLSRFHAKQLCPIPPSDHTHQEAIKLLSNSPALLLILRGIACNRRFKQLLRPGPPPRLSPHQSISSLSLLTSDSLSQAFRYTTLFFADKELFCDPTSWPLVSTVPSAWTRSDILRDLQKPPLLLYSVLVVRGGEWRVMVKVVDRLGRAGFQVCGVTMRRREEEDGREGECPESGNMLLSTRDTGMLHSEVAVCVSRQNAVWYLNHELRPFLSSTNASKRHSLHSPTTFSEAVSMVRHFFPRGVCGAHGAVATDYRIDNRLIDEFSGLRCGLSTPPTLSSSPLTESTCIILPPSHLTPPSHHPTPYYLQLLEVVAQAGFTVTGVQMTQLSQRTAHSLSALGVEDTKELVSWPSCLILLLQRDNAASCFRYILKSAAHSSARGVCDIDEILTGAIIPDSHRTAVAILAALMKEE